MNKDPHVPDLVPGINHELDKEKTEEVINNKDVKSDAHNSDEKMIKLNKAEHPDLNGENNVRQIKDELCAAIWDCINNSQTKVQEMESQCSVQGPQFKSEEVISHTDLKIEKGTFMMDKVEESDLCGENKERQIKDELCDAIWNCITNSQAEVQEMKSQCSVHHSQVKSEETINNEQAKTRVNEARVNGTDVKVINLNKVEQSNLCGDINWGQIKDEFCDSITSSQAEVQVMENPFSVQHSHLVKHETFVEILPERTRFIEQKTTDFEMSHEQKGKRLMNELSESVKVRECQVMLVDFMAKRSLNDGRLALGNGDCNNLLENEFCVSVKGDKCSVKGGKCSLNGGCCNNIHKCDVCGRGFTRFCRLKVHLSKHTGEKPYKCDVCGVGFTHNVDLKKHSRAHTYKCDVCEREFAQSCTLKAHKRTHTGEKPYKCDVCGKGFAQNGNLNLHKKKHSGEKPYNCDICGVGFHEYCILKVHKRIHTGEKPYKCGVCGVGFAQSGTLKAHKRTHTGEKPYKCDVCGVGFTQNGHLIVHKRKHTGEKPYKCDVCGVGFTLNGTLKEHKRKHT